MKILDKFTIKGRGDVFSLDPIEREIRHAGAKLLRLGDGREWPIRGVERFCKHIGDPKLRVGENVAVLMPDGTDLAAGDEVLLIEHCPRSIYGHNPAQAGEGCPECDALDAADVTR